MASTTPAIPTSKAMLWTGRVISTLMVLFLLMDSIMKLLKPQFVVEGTIKLGYQENLIVGIGIVLIACTIIYAIPRTSILGAILLTGYLGGAVASHLRAGQGPFPITFAIVVGVLIWLGLFFRDVRLRTLIPLRR